MAIRPRFQNNQNAYTSDYIPGKGYALPDSTSGYQTSPYPIANPPYLIGVDYVQAYLPSGTTLVTFPNLPIRGLSNPSANQLNQPQTLAINPGDLLIFVTSINIPGTVTPQVIDTSNVLYTVPALSQGIYKAFQASVTLTSAQTTSVYGTLYLQRGVLT
jgi:hypothetical protein